MRNGIGIFKCASFSYEGSWVNDEREGAGTLITKDG
jgi:hypothetical protein